MSVSIQREVEKIERGLGYLATVGSTAPFVGLFGTVWGIMTAFQAIASPGLALVVVAVCYWLIEVRERRRWAIPFAPLGVNALVLFFLSTLVARLLSIVKVGAEGHSLQVVLFDHVFAPLASPVNASLAYALVYVVMWWAIMWMLYRWNIRLRV